MMNNREIAEAIWKQHCGVKGFNILDAITQALDATDSKWARETAEIVAQATKKIRRSEKNLAQANTQIATLQGALEEEIEINKKWLDCHDDWQEQMARLKRALDKYRYCQRRMLEKWADGDQHVKNELWTRLHACEDEATEALAAVPSLATSKDTEGSLCDRGHIPASAVGNEAEPSGPMFVLDCSKINSMQIEDIKRIIELRPRTTDIHTRKDAIERVFEGDWIKLLEYRDKGLSPESSLSDNERVME